MINVKPMVVEALEENETLISLLGGPRIYQLKAPNADEYPRITYFELNNVDSDYADDDALTSFISMQISVWVKNPEQLSPIAMEVDQTMRSLGFYRTSAVDLYEDDTQVFHKALRYSAKFLKEE